MAMEPSKCDPLTATVKLPGDMAYILKDVHTAREQDGMLILESFDYGLVAAFTKGEWLSVTITTPERDFASKKPGEA
jgi:hypothetical protein